jgi:hypothetical protein
MFHVFISYGSPDANFALYIQAALERLNISAFLFSRDAPPGVKLHRLMRDGINSAERVVLICSRQSLNRSGVLNEIEECLQREAREGGRPILIPITLDNYVFTDWRPEHPGLALAVRDRVIADFSGTTSDPGAFRIATERLALAIASAGDPGYLIQYLRARHTVRLLDAAGSRAALHWERWFIPRSPNITRLQARDLTATGELQMVSTNIGTLGGTIDEGGRKLIHIDLASPLPMGAEIYFAIEMLALDSYLEPPFWATVTMSAIYDQLELVVEFPADRRCRSASSSRTFGGRRNPGPTVNISDSQTKLTTRISNPQFGAIYGVEFDW